MDGHQVLTEVVVGSHLRLTIPGEPYQSVVWQLCPSCLLFASGNFTLLPTLEGVLGVQCLHLWVQNRIEDAGFFFQAKPVRRFIS